MQLHLIGSQAASSAPDGVRRLRGVCIAMYNRCIWMHDHEDTRQAAILDLVDRDARRSQEELRRRLRASASRSPRPPSRATSRTWASSRPRRRRLPPPGRRAAAAGVAGRACSTRSRIPHGRRPRPAARRAQDRPGAGPAAGHRHRRGAARRRRRHDRRRRHGPRHLPRRGGGGVAWPAASTRLANEPESPGLGTRDSGSATMNESSSRTPAGSTRRSPSRGWPSATAPRSWP